MEIFLKDTSVPSPDMQVTPKTQHLWLLRLYITLDSHIFHNILHPKTKHKLHQVFTLGLHFSYEHNHLNFGSLAFHTHFRLVASHNIFHPQSTTQIYTLYYSVICLRLLHLCIRGLKTNSQHNLECGV